MSAGERMTEADWQLKAAKRLFNETWDFLDKPARTPDEDALMVHWAHASRALWQAIGTPRNHAIGEWLVSRVYAVTGHAERAVHHARLCLAIAEREGFEGYDASFPHEAMARALSVAGDKAAHVSYAKARALAALIKDADDRKILEDDLATIVLP